LCFVLNNCHKIKGDQQIRGACHYKHKPPHIKRRFYKTIKGVIIPPDQYHFYGHYGVHDATGYEPRGPVGIVLGTQHLEPFSQIVAFFSDELVEENHETAKRHHDDVEGAVHGEDIEIFEESIGDVWEGLQRLINPWNII